MTETNNSFVARDHFVVAMKGKDLHVKISHLGEYFISSFINVVESPPGELSKLYDWLLRQNNCDGHSLKKRGLLKTFVIQSGGGVVQNVSVFWNGLGFCLGVS
ncbi:MAG: hypothetical protein WCT07_00750 [Candidatus Paceibacterota bacterium]|jgi:hypothetical protein